MSQNSYLSTVRITVPSDLAIRTLLSVHPHRERLDLVEIQGEPLSYRPAGVFLIRPVGDLLLLASIWVRLYSENRRTRTHPTMAAAGRAASVLATIIARRFFFGIGIRLSVMPTVMDVSIATGMIH